MGNTEKVASVPLLGSMVRHLIPQFGPGMVWCSLKRVAAVLIVLGVLVSVTGAFSQNFALDARFLTHDTVNQRFISFLMVNGLLNPASADVVWIEEANRKSLLVHNWGSEGPEVIALFHELLQADIELYSHEHDSQDQIRFFPAGEGLYLRYHPFQEHVDEVLRQFDPLVESDVQAVSLALTALAWSGYRHSLSLVSNHRLAACFVIPVEAVKSLCIISVLPLIGRGYSDYLARHGLTKFGLVLAAVGIMLWAWQVYLWRRLVGVNRL